jgi:hypothetical protein
VVEELRPLDIPHLLGKSAFLLYLLVALPV